MKKVLGILVVTVFTTSSAFGGLVSLFPAIQEVAPSAVSTLVDFDVAVDSVVGGDFGTFDILMGSNDGLLMNDFDFNPAISFWGGLDLADIRCVGSGCFGGPVDPPFYPVGSPIAGANALLQGVVFVDPDNIFNPVFPLSAPIPFGILTVEVPGGLAPDVYDILVDGALDGGRSNVLLSPSLNTELLFGALNPGLGIAGQIVVTPEPATLALLGVGGLVAALRRRRRKA